MPQTPGQDTACFSPLAMERPRVSCSAGLQLC
ncbi:hypothetical protein E2C01_041079 [Portunus trituberculatus]|uniref:Uncharacterized protein n=1 Tax=Portunus trituberculatus TaxID=210409 RepID=A0A5B7FPQ2_PORTR|nr:hypothetical protein [Portunus trituberculatus]